MSSGLKSNKPVNLFPVLDDEQFMCISVSDEVLQKNLNTMEKSLKQLEIDIKNLNKSQNEGDKFSQVMNEFIASAKSQYEVMKGMYKMVDNLYKEMGKYYTFDIKKYAMEEFFSDIKSFKEFFVVRLVCYRSCIKRDSYIFHTIIFYVLSLE